MDIALGQKTSRTLTLTATFVKLAIFSMRKCCRLIHPAKPVTQLKITVKRWDRETALEGEVWCYTFR